MSDAEDELEGDDIADYIISEGELVFSHEWDSGGPGAGAGVEQVYHWNGQFAIFSADLGNSGPFATLDEALADQDLLMVTSATTRIDCSLLTAKELARRLQCDEDGYQVVLNGERYAYREEAGEFQRCVG
jgi:hypothetical protein